MVAQSSPEFMDNKTGVGTDKSVYKGIEVDGSQPLNITLAWTDRPGATFADWELVNDLDLILVDPNGTTIWGNGVDGGDGVNNVEGIRIASPIAGTYRLEIFGYDVPMGKSGKQPFAVAVSGGQILQDWSGSLVINGGAGKTASKTVSLDVSATSPTGFDVAAYRLGQPVNGTLTWGSWISSTVPITTSYDLWPVLMGTNRFRSSSKMR